MLEIGCTGRLTHLFDCVKSPHIRTPLPFSLGTHTIGLHHSVGKSTGTNMPASTRLFISVFTASYNGTGTGRGTDCEKGCAFSFKVIVNSFLNWPTPSKIPVYSSSTFTFSCSFSFVCASTLFILLKNSKYSMASTPSST